MIPFTFSHDKEGAAVSNHLYNVVSKIEEVVSSLCIGGMTIVITMQVFNRYVLQSSLDWSEELGRYLFIWAVYVGCSYAIKEDRHLEVTIIREYIGPRLKKAVLAVAYGLTIVFCLFCVVYGIEMTRFLLSTGQKTPALEIKMYWVFASVPVGLGLMALRTAMRLWQVFTTKGHPAEELEA